MNFVNLNRYMFFPTLKSCQFSEMAVDCFPVGLFKRIYVILVLCGLTLCNKYGKVIIYFY